jgi:hypothetical protein
MSRASNRDASGPPQWLKQWNMGVPQKTCQPAIGNGQLRTVFTLLSYAYEQGGHATTTGFPFFFSG